MDKINNRVMTGTCTLCGWAFNPQGKCGCPQPPYTGHPHETRRVYSKEEMDRFYDPTR